MSLDVAQNAELPEKNKPEITAVVVADILVNHAKCSLLYVPLVARKPQYLSNLLVINPCIAVIAISLARVATGKPLICRSLPSLICLGRFFAMYSMGDIQYPYNQNDPSENPLSNREGVF